MHRFTCVRHFYVPILSSPSFSGLVLSSNLSQMGSDFVEWPALQRLCR